MKRKIIGAFVIVAMTATLAVGVNALAQPKDTKPVPPGTKPVPPATRPPATRPEPRPVERVAVFEIVVPAEAAVEINGHKTTSSGSVRRFESPAMPVGKSYTYTLKMTLGDQTVSKEISVTPDRVTTHDFRGEFKSGPAVMPALKLQLPVSLDLKAGDKKSILIRVTRTDVKGKVEVSFSGLPKGVTIKDVTIAEDKDQVGADVEVAADAAAGKAEVNVNAVCGQVKTNGILKVGVGAKVPVPTKPAPPATKTPLPPQS